VNWNLPDFEGRGRRNRAAAVAPDPEALSVQSMEKESLRETEHQERCRVANVHLFKIY
jgi:hypothetical protein